MIRGALILAVGFTLGYSKAIRDSEELSGLLRELIDELKHFPADTTSAPAEEVADAVEVPEEVPEPETDEGETS